VKNKKRAEPYSPLQISEKSKKKKIIGAESRNLKDIINTSIRTSLSKDEANIRGSMASSNIV
jgi:hypothetical protein